MIGAIGIAESGLNRARFFRVRSAIIKSKSTGKQETHSHESNTGPKVGYVCNRKFYYARDALGG